MERLRELWSRHFQEVRARLAPERERTWRRVGYCLLGCLGCSGLAPGAAIWTQMLGQDPDSIFGSCDAVTGTDCVRQYSAGVEVFVISGAFSSLVLLPIVVLVDDLGTRRISIVGGMTTIVGHMLFFSALIPGYITSQGASRLVQYLGVFLTETGAHMAFTVMQGWAWALDDSRGVVFIFFSVVCNLSTLLPLMIRSIFDPVLTFMVTVVLPLTLKAFPNPNHLVIAIWHFAFYMLWPIFGTICIYSYAVEQDAYVKAAEEALDMAIPTRQFNVGTTLSNLRQVLKSSQKVMLQNQSFCGCHAIFIAALALSNCWAQLYIYFAGNYGMDVFGQPDKLTGKVSDKDGGYQLASVVATTVCWSGIFVSIGGTLLAWKYGMVPIVCLVIVAEVIALFSILIPNEPHQIIVALAASVTLSLSNVMVNRHLHHYSPPKLLAPVYCLFNCYRAAGSMVVMHMSVNCVQEIGKQVTFLAVTFLGIISMVIYLVFINIFPLPESLPHIQEEVDDLCTGYGCKTLDDVLYIMGFENAPQGTKMLTGAGPEGHSKFVMCVNPRRLEETMLKLSIEEVSIMLDKGPAWIQREAELTGVEGSIASFALTPQLWSQFMHEQNDIRMLTRRVSSDRRQEEEAEKLLEVERAEKAGAALAHKILRAMNARVHTKELVRVVRQHDLGALDHWMMNKDVGLMCDALWDMVDWDDGLEDDYTQQGKVYDRSFEKFKSLMPFKSLAEVLQRRTDLKPFVIEILKADLGQVVRQEHIRRAERKAAEQRVWAEKGYHSTGSLNSNRSDDKSDKDG